MDARKRKITELYVQDIIANEMYMIPDIVLEKIMNDISIHALIDNPGKNKK
jgi:hypothetical protein